MSLAKRLENHAKRVEIQLASLFGEPRKDAANCGFVPALLDTAMAYGTLGGGKRFRPFLVLETAELFGANLNGACNVAAALECVHCYSLIHDDLPSMDNDDLRRGRPTVHRNFDEATAILAGDALLTLGFELLSRPATHPDPLVRLTLITNLAQAAGRSGMVGGQILDLQAEKNTNNVQDITRIQAMKTGALIVFACEAGARLGGASNSEINAMAKFGRAIGLAFQIADDLLDFDGDPAVTGKATGKDNNAGKATFVSLLGAGGARDKLAALQQDALDAIKDFGSQADMLKEAVAFISQRRQ